MSNATFHNFTDKPFTGHWNGKPKTFKPRERVYMPRYLAEHFAKHLTNSVLIEKGKESYTSPKKPEDVPVFMEIFNKAFIRDEISEGQNELDAEIASAQSTAPSMNIDTKPNAPIDTGPAAAQESAETITGPGKEPQVINPPDGDDDESNFEHGDKNAQA